MATVRAQRLLNSVLSGTTGPATLQTLLGTASNLSDWQQVLNERGKARLLSSSTTGANTVFQSALALDEYFLAPATYAEFRLNSVAIAALAAYPNTARSSAFVMDRLFSHQPTRAAIFANSALSIALFQSAAMPSIWPYFYTSTAAGGMPPGVVRTPTSGNFSTTGFTDVATDGAGTWVAVAAGGTDRVARSIDNGLTWVNGSNTVANSTAWQGVAYGAGTFVAVGANGAIMTSATGNADWVTRTSGTSGFFANVRFAAGLFVAVTGTQIFTSPTGITWTLRSTSGADLQTIAYGNGMWVVANRGGYNFYTSPNGTTWTNRNSPDSNQVYHVVFGGGFFLLLGAFGVFRSTDGITYTTVRGAISPSPHASGMRPFYANGLFFLPTGSTDALVCTPDGVTTSLYPAADRPNYIRVVSGGFSLGQTVFVRNSLVAPSQLVTMF